jgi:platelet-activating factor acetylhydrolase
MQNRRLLDNDDDDDNDDARIDLELTPLNSEDPDAPLAMADSSPSSPLTQQASFPRPKWLSTTSTTPLSPSSSSSSSSSGRRAGPAARTWSARNDRLVRLARWGAAAAATWLLAAVRPRRSWRYLVCAVASLYVLVCVVRGVPLLYSALPDTYSAGPHRVGAVDIEVPLATPLRVSDAVFKAGADKGAPAFEVETVLFTLYYPVARTSPKPRGGPRKHYWIPKPVGLTARGYARLAYMDNFIMRPILTFALWLVGGGITIPAEVDAPLLGTDDNDKDSTAAANDKFPVMVFSHGMASSRTDYTHYLSELASTGRVVAAIEHRDGSSPGSLVINTNVTDSHNKHRHTQREVLAFTYKDLVPGNKDDDGNESPPMDIVRMHTDQLAFRDVEIRETVRVLGRLNDGRGADILAANARREGSGAQLAKWAGRLDIDAQLTIGGHSYGATGALQALKGAPSGPSVGPDDRGYNPAVGGVILDPGKSSGPLNHDVAVPLLIVHSNSWSSTVSLFYGSPHFDTVRDLARQVLNRTRRRASWFLTSLGTSHPSVTDAPLLEPLLLRWTTGASANVGEALGEYVRVTHEFFAFLESDNERPPRGSVLDEEVTHDAYKHWVSEERQKSFPPGMAKFWEVHISPQGPNGEDNNDGHGGSDDGKRDEI